MLKMVLSSFLCCFALFSKGINNSNIPRTLWQTYKTKHLPPPAEKARSSWQTQNLDFNFQLYDDTDIENFIIKNFDPCFLYFYHSLPLGVMKADLWRYLIILKEGGYYSDIDTICKLSIDKWPIIIHNNQSNKDVLLVSIEPGGLPFFCQWTFAATKNHPALNYVCNFILKNFQNNSINTSNPHFVHSTTGPAIWTQALIEYLELPKNTPSYEVFEQYSTNFSFRKSINKKGVFLLPSYFFQGLVSYNEYGGDCYGEGYIGWKNELKKIQSND